MATVPGYDAFISYSHQHDRALGLALQVGLERFAKPWRKLRTSRIFIDKANLAASPELWGSVEDALASSRWFILLASDGAAQSVWVDREVQWWLGHRPLDRFLIVATSPGMKWDKAKRDWSPATPVPPALRGAFSAEPLWIDLSDLPPGARASRVPTDQVASIAAAIRGVPKDTLIGEHLREHRRTMRLVRSALAVLAVLTALAVTASVIAFGQRNVAIQQRNQAIYENVLTQALQVAASNPSLAAQFLLTAYRLHPNENVASRLINTENMPLANPITSTNAVSVTFGQNGRTLASGSADGTVRLWNMSDPGRPRPLGQPFTGGTSSILSVASSPDGRTLAAGDYGGTVRLWNVSNHAGAVMLSRILTDTGGVLSVAFSPDGRILAAAGYDGTVRLWDVSDPARPISIPVAPLRSVQWRSA